MSRSERGVSLLLEAVFGLTLFALAMLFVFALFPATRRSAEMARERDVANNLARDYLERERALPYDDVGNITPAATTPPEQIAIPTTFDGVSSQTNYDVEVIVTEPEVDKRKVVRVVVRWLSSGIEHSVSLETYKVKYPELVTP
ncbi:MAG: type II secretion system protein J [Vulcanimicrobiota bacterium]